MKIIPFGKCASWYPEVRFGAWELVPVPGRCRVATRRAPRPPLGLPPATRASCAAGPASASCWPAPTRSSSAARASAPSTPAEATPETCALEISARRL